jgi:3-(3-hydroxy-phenyl)propionate hydroxylase
MTSMTPPQVDVLIVGGGPVGVTGAILLVKQGLKVLVAEREPGIYPLPRAAHIDHEAMRIFQAAGIADALLATTREAKRYDFLNAAGDVLMRLETGAGDTLSGWPASNMIHQPSLEQLLNDAIAASPTADFRRLWGLVDFAVDDAGVTAHFETPEGRQEIQTKYLLGCDGANSTVRSLADIQQDDLVFNESWLVIDTIVKQETALPDCNLQICDPARPTTCVMMGNGRHRWEFMLLPGETPEAMQKPETIQTLMAPWEVEGAVEVERTAVYRFGATLAKNWRQGRVLLAGDAAHLMPPFAGQGLCSGLRDVDNLAWKLAMIVQHGADEALLDSYQSEREPHVRAVIDLAIMMGQMVCVSDPEAAAARDADLMAQRKQNGDASGAMAFPPLLAGTILEGSPQAGMLFPQVERLDDVLGRAAYLISKTDVSGALPIDYLTLEDARLKPVRSVIETWLDVHQVEAVLVRGDRYIFGTGEGAPLAAAFGRAVGVAS